MMKKLLLLFAAAAMVLAFSMPAAAAEYVGHQECCENCPKCDLDDILCPETSLNEDDFCDYFDYDSPVLEGKTEPYAVKTGAHGYDESENWANANCKVIFDICCCDEEAIAYFTVGQTIGVRMTSLTDGFYFTGDTVHIDIYEDDPPASEPDACDLQDMRGPEPFPGPYIYTNAAGDVIGPAVKTSGCTVPIGEKAVVLESEKLTGYVITDTDINESRCMWWFDMPAMRYDVDDATRGARVNVKIELLTAESGICGDWKVICECIVDLGVWCPERDYGCMYFPYVLPGATAWHTGIVVTNLTSGTSYAVAPADMVATFTLTDKTGAQFTYVKDDFTNVVWSTWLNDILAEFDGTPATGPGWLKVKTNFEVDGYEFLTDGVFGAGTLPRRPHPCW